MRVLLIEDHDETREVSALILTALGDDVRAVSTGGAGLVEIESGWPEAVALDIGLPDTTGWRVLEAARQIGSRAIIFIVSAWDYDKHLLAGLADGVRGKPVNIGELRAELAEAVNAQRVRDALALQRR